MISSIIKDWLNTVNCTIEEEKKGILFLDNTICHPNITSSKPEAGMVSSPNLSSVVQPMGQSLIYMYIGAY